MTPVAGSGRHLRRPTRRTALWIVGVSLLVLVPSAIRISQIASRTLDGPRIAVPGTSTLHLDRGRWVIFERTGSTKSLGPLHLSDNSYVTVHPGGVTVTDPAGGAIYPGPVSGLQTITSDAGEIFTGAVELTAPTGGEYEIVVSDARPGAVMVARPLSSTALGLLRWGLLGGLSGLAFLLGVVFVLAPRTDGAASVTTAVSNVDPRAHPPGWHPDPYGGQQLRWWDGSQWSEHTSPWP